MGFRVLGHSKVWGETPPPPPAQVEYGPNNTSSFSLWHFYRSKARVTESRGEEGVWGLGGLIKGLRFGVTLNPKP